MEESRREDDGAAASDNSGEQDKIECSADGKSPAATSERPERKRKRFSKEGLQVLKSSYDKRGICYLGYIPPGMRPSILKRILSQYADVTRVQLQMEDPKNWHKRKRKGGDTRKFFVEGWVEFADKRIAKRIAGMLNGEPMGGRHRSRFYHELWCIKYLPKFKWENLLEGIENQKHVFQHRLQAELSEAKRDQEFYLTKVNQAQREEKRIERDIVANEDGDGSAEQNPDEKDSAEATKGGTSKKKMRMRRSFKQTKANPDPVSDSDGEIAPDVMMLVGGQNGKGLSD
ncbi:hypothetical protein BSKO_01509 [Bryopsis sp. KO-2023]|nr:hypothetical protein BSKO_01509 [Bryopsis sp. KO-2023]